MTRFESFTKHSNFGLLVSSDNSFHENLRHTMAFINTLFMATIFTDTCSYRFIFLTLSTYEIYYQEILPNALSHIKY